MRLSTIILGPYINPLATQYQEDAQYRRRGRIPALCCEPARRACPTHFSRLSWVWAEIRFPGCCRYQSPGINCHRFSLTCCSLGSVYLLMAIAQSEMSTTFARLNWKQIRAICHNLRMPDGTSSEQHFAAIQPEQPRPLANLVNEYSDVKMCLL